MDIAGSGLHSSAAVTAKSGTVPTSVNSTVWGQSLLRPDSTQLYRSKRHELVEQKQYGAVDQECNED